MDRYRKEVLQVSTRKHGINVQYLYDMFLVTNENMGLCLCITKPRKNGSKLDI